MTVRLPEVLAGRLAACAGGRRGGKSVVMRAALEAFLEVGGDPARAVVVSRPPVISAPRKVDALAARQAALNKPKGL